MEHSGVRFIVVTSGNNSLYEKVCAELKEEQICFPVFRASTVGEAASLTKQMGKSVVITDSRELADVKEHLPSPERNTLFGGDPRLPEKGSCEEEVAYIRFYIRMHIDEELMDELHDKSVSHIPSGEVVVAAGLSEYAKASDTAVHQVFERADARMYAEKQRLKDLGSLTR